MNALQIENIVKIITRNTNLTYGIFTPKTLRADKNILILNTSEMPGAHWLLIFNAFGESVYYDSFGKCSPNYIKV